MELKLLIAAKRI